MVPPDFVSLNAPWYAKGYQHYANRMCVVHASHLSNTFVPIFQSENTFQGAKTAPPLDTSKTPTN